MQQLEHSENADSGVLLKTEMPSTSRSGTSSSSTSPSPSVVQGGIRKDAQPQQPFNLNQQLNAPFSARRAVGNPLVELLMGHEANLEMDEEDNGEAEADNEKLERSESVEELLD